MKKQSRAYLLAGITILFWSTVATAFKLALESQSTLQVLFIASLTSTLFLFFYLVFSGNLSLCFKASGKEYMYSSVLGFLNPFLYYLMLFKAYANLPAQVAQPLNLIWPIVLVIISIPLLGQKIPAKSFLALIISFGGIILVSSQGAGAGFQKEQIPFMLLAISTSVIWSFFWILNVRDRRNETVKLFLNFFFSTVYLLIYILLSGEEISLNNRELFLNVYIGLFEMGLAFLLWMKALQLSETTDKISNLVFIFPFISLIFIHYILGEKIHLTTFYGLILVVGGIIIQRASFRKKKDEEYRQNNIGD
jgi:drug/metabolite transporter (DMT)-like permease